MAIITSTPSFPPPIVPLPYSPSPLLFEPDGYKIMETSVSENVQYGLEIEIEQVAEDVSEYTARTALACFDGDRDRALRWLDQNLDYIQNQYDDALGVWKKGLQAWLDRGYSESAYRQKPGFPQAKRKALLRAKEIIGG